MNLRTARLLWLSCLGALVITVIGPGARLEAAAHEVRAQSGTFRQSGLAAGGSMSLAQAPAGLR